MSCSHHRDGSSLMQDDAKAGPARRELFPAERAVTQPVLVGQVVQRLQRRALFSING